MSKRGRPPKPDAKRKGIRFRLRDDQTEMLDKLSEKTGKSKTDIFVDLMTKEYEHVVGGDGVA